MQGLTVVVTWPASFYEIIAPNCQLQRGKSVDIYWVYNKLIKIEFDPAEREKN